MQMRHGMKRFVTRGVHAVLMLALTAALLESASATEFVGVDTVDGKLLYMPTSRTAFTLATTGTNPDGVIVGPYEQLIYALAAAGEVHSFNPYTKIDTTLATGLTTPVNIVLQPGCRSILVSDIGVNKIFQVELESHALTTFYSGPDKIVGMTYDNLGDLFATDQTLNAIVEFSFAGTITNQSPSGSPLTAPDGLAFDAHTSALYATSNTGQVIYSAPLNLATVNSISFPVAPVLDGIVSDGGGNIYVVGVKGTTGTIFKYEITKGVTTTLNTAPGLNDIALIPPGPCIKAPGTESECEATGK
jgi:hypothetical protein